MEAQKTTIHKHRADAQDRSGTISYLHFIFDCCRICAHKLRQCLREALIPLRVHLKAQARRVEKLLVAMQPTVFSTSVVARSAEASGNGQASMLSSLVDLVSGAAKDVRVNTATALAISQRIEDMVATVTLDIEQDSLHGAQCAMALTQFQLSVAAVHRELKVQAQKSYLTQLLHHARDRESLIARSERVRDAFNLLMVNVSLQSATLSTAAAARTETAGLSKALASIAGDAAQHNTDGSVLTELVVRSATRLPPRPQIYFGRQAETDAVVVAVTERESGRVAILGGPGMGKTTLSVAALHHPAVAERFGDRRYFVACDSAEGHSRCLTILTAAFGIVAADLRVAQQQLQGFLSAEPSLVVLDNFESAWESPEQRLDAEQLLQSLDSIENLSLIVTLRGTERPNGLRWTRPFLGPLAPLSNASATQIFLSIADDAVTSHALLEKLISPLDNVPLAIVLMANLAQYESLQSLLSQWDVLETAMLARGGAKTRQESLDLSITLSLQSPRMRAVPSAQVLLGVLSLLPHGVVDTDLALWGLGDTARALSVLIQSSLATASADHRIRVLAPIRRFVLANYPPSDASAALVYTHYFTLVGLVRESTEWSHLVSDVTPEIDNIESIILYALKHSPSSRRDALEAFSGLCSFYAEHPIGRAPDLLPLALAAATGEEFDKTRADLLFYWGRMVNNTLVLGDSQTLYRDARELYQRVGDTAGDIDCGVFLSTHLDGADAVAEMVSLCRAADALGDPARVARCAHYHAAALERAGQSAAAIAEYARAIELARAGEFPRRHVLIAQSQYWTAVNLVRLGRRRAAFAMHEAAMTTFEAAGDARGTELTLSSLAAAVLEQGHAQKAIEYAERALAISGAQATRRHVVTLVVLADAYMWSGDTAAADATIERIVATVPDGSITPDFRSYLLMLQGTLAQLRGDLVGARAILQHARMVARERDPVETPNALESRETFCIQLLADLEHAAGRVREAEMLATAAAVMRRHQAANKDIVHCLVILAEVTDDDDLAECLLDAVQVSLYHDEANILLAKAALRRATMARRRGQQALARRQAEKVLFHFGDWKDTPRIELARSIIAASS